MVLSENVDFLSANRLFWENRINRQSWRFWPCVWRHSQSGEYLSMSGLAASASPGSALSRNSGGTMVKARSCFASACSHSWRVLGSCSSGSSSASAMGAIRMACRRLRAHSILSKSGRACSQISFQLSPSPVFDTHSSSSQISSTFQALLVNRGPRNYPQCRVTRLRDMEGLQTT